MRARIVLLVLLALPASAAPNMEQRCSELGAVCECSEPLRFPSADLLIEDTDPPDSEGPGAKECAGGFALDAEPNGIQLVDRVDNATNLDFPGTNPPKYVLKMTSGAIDEDNGWLVSGNRLTGVENETVCGRSYQRFGHDLATIAEPMRAKLAWGWFTDNQLIQFQLDIDGSGHLDTAPGDCTGTIDVQTAGKQSWLRHEFCFDITPGSVSSRQRVTVIDTGQVETIVCGPFEEPTPASFSEFLIANLYLQTAGNPNLFGSRYVTFAIQTRKPLDPSFWPGPACELEGDCDEDGDGVPHSQDNCSERYNPGQEDKDHDGCGDVCDADFDQNGIAALSDFGIFKASYGKSSGSPGFDPRVDMDDNGAVGTTDWGLFKAEYGGPPGPSGLPASQRTLPACEQEGDRDEDGDGVLDSLDNCTAHFNPAQEDKDHDGCGDVCDADFDQDGTVGLSDFGIFKASYGKSAGSPGFDPRADMDDDGAVGLSDFGLFHAEYGRAPGPSGLPTSQKTSPACP